MTLLPQTPEESLTSGHCVWNLMLPACDKSPLSPLGLDTTCMAQAPAQTGDIRLSGLRGSPGVLRLEDPDPAGDPASLLHGGGAGVDTE